MSVYAYRGVIRKRHKNAISIYPAYDFYALEVASGCSDYRLNFRGGVENELDAFVGKTVAIKGWVSPGTNVLFIDDKADIKIEGPKKKSPRPGG